jgi:hypothetical protein
MYSLCIGTAVSNILQLVMDYNYCAYIAGYWKMVSATVKENGIANGEVSDLPPGD